jgi:hypothetical protein
MAGERPVTESSIRIKTNHLPALERWAICLFQNFDVEGVVIADFAVYKEWLGQDVDGVGVI